MKTRSAQGRRNEPQTVAEDRARTSSAVKPPARVWKVLEVVGVSGRYLEERGVESGRLNAEHLLAHVLGADRLQLYLHFDRPLTAGELSRFKPLLRRRAAREPLQYVMGAAAFRNLELAVEPGVAIPRPETEHLIDVVRDAAGQGRVFDSALDVGTGSGCIAIALADEGLARTVTATDVSEDALGVARRNAAASGRAEIDFRAGALLDPVRGMTFDLVLSNPPYLTEDEWSSAQPEVRQWEPHLAMVAGDGGLAVIRDLISGLGPVVRSGGWVGLEVGSSQADTVAGLLRERAGWTSVTTHRDLAGRPRYVVAAARTSADASPDECSGDPRGAAANAKGE